MVRSTGARTSYAPLVGEDCEGAWLTLPQSILLRADEVIE
jgi:hypothetical protein